MNKSLKHLVYFVCLYILMLSGTVFSANERFRSISTGDWNSTGTWEMSTNNGGTWIPATSTPSDTSGLINVRNPNIVTITADVSSDQLTVENGGTLSINADIILTILDGSGTDLTLLSGAIVTGDGTVKTQGANLVVNIDVNSIFNADLVVSSGNTMLLDPGSPFTSTIGGNITIDNGASLEGGAGGYFIIAKGNILNNGTLLGAGTSSFVMKGASLVNNGSISIHNLRFDSTTAISGNGTYTSNAITINSSGLVSLANDVTFAPITSFTISSGGVLNPTNIFKFENGTFHLNNGASILNSGTFRTQDTVTLDVNPNSSFQAPINISNGITTLYDAGSPFTSPVYGTLTIDAGAVLRGGPGGYNIIAYNNVINEGSIIGVSSTSFTMKGASLLNNGLISITNLEFDSTTAVSGSGSFTSPNTLISGNGNVSLSNDITYTPGNDFTINSNGVLDLNGNIFTLSTGTFNLNPGGTVAATGTFRTQDTVTLNIRHNNNFNCALLINTGLTTLLNTGSPFTSTLFGTLTIDAGAALAGGSGGYFIFAMNNVTNNGTIQGNSSFVMKGSDMVNNNVVSIQTMRFDSTTTLSGTGIYTSLTMIINSTGDVTLTSDMNFALASSLTINTGGNLDLNTNTLSFSSASLLVNNGATIENSGLLKTDGTVTLDIRNTANFNVPLQIESGTTNTYSAASPFAATLNGPVTVDSGATWHAFNGGYTLNVNNDITNNGTISGVINALKFFGTNLINNGSIIINIFNFEPGNHTLQGTGSWGTLGRFLSGSVTTLLSTHQMRDIDIDAGGTFDITSMKLLLSGNGSPIINDGTFITAGSTIEYNGTVLQAAAIPNVVYHSLTINNAANVSLTSARTVPAVLTLTLGEFTNGANLTLGDGATIVRQDGSLSGVPIFGTTVDVIYIGSNLTNSSFELPASGTVLRDLTINNTGGVTLADARTVNRTLYLTNGTFVNTTNLNMADNITINRNTGILNNLPVFPASVNVIYSGTTDNVATGVELPLSLTTLKKLTVDKTGGIILNDDITVNDSLKIISGYLNLNGNVITMGATAYLTETPGNTVRGSSGYLVAVRDLNAPTELNVAGLGAIFTTTENMGTTEVRRGHTIQTEDTTESIERYYEINPANNNSLNATFGFRYDNSELNGSIASNLILFKSTNDGVNWFSVPGSNNTFINELTAFGVNSFSRWTAGDSLTSLPVELASFTSSIENRNVKLNWSTTAEVNNSGFEIERTTEGNEQWQKIGFVEGNGTTNSPKDFSFTDRNLNTGKYNYRLKQIDYNGSFEYYSLQNLVEIGVPSEFKISQNYPNPFNPSTKIDFALPSDGNVRISLYDMTGREVAVMLNESRSAGYHTINFNASNLSTGSYFYRITAESGGQSFVLTKKLTLIK